MLYIDILRPLKIGKLIKIYKDMKIRKFNERYELDSEASKMKKMSFSTAQFNALSEDELKRFLLCYNDGQGDHGSHTFAEAVDAVSSMFDETEADKVHEMTPSQILDKLYEAYELTGNNSDCYFFDVKTNQFYHLDFTD
jgi:hypothetical protein